MDASRFAAESTRHRHERWVPRITNEDVLDDTRKATLVVGPRQAGKWSWLWSRLTGHRADEVLWLNCEEVTYAELGRVVATLTGARGADAGVF